MTTAASPYSSPYHRMAMFSGMNLLICNIGTGSNGTANTGDVVVIPFVQYKPIEDGLTSSASAVKDWVEYPWPGAVFGSANGALNLNVVNDLHPTTVKRHIFHDVDYLYMATPTQIEACLLANVKTTYSAPGTTDSTAGATYQWMAGAD